MYPGNPSGDININHGLYTTTLDGEGARRVVHITGDITPTLSGLRVTNGNDASQLGGGGIRSYNAHPNIIGCQVYNNMALYNGGIYLYISDGALLVESDIYNNKALSNYGGGIGIRDSSDVILSDNSVYSNTTPGSGGGIYIYNGNQVTLTRQEVFGNTALSTSNGGGGIYIGASQLDPLNPQGDVSIIESNIYINQVAKYGGGIYVQKVVSLTLSSNDIHGHNAYYGGGIYTGEVDHTEFISNDVFENRADSSGGVFI